MNVPLILVQQLAFASCHEGFLWNPSCKWHIMYHLRTESRDLVSFCGVTAECMQVAKRNLHQKVENRLFTPESPFNRKCITEKTDSIVIIWLQPKKSLVTFWVQVDESQLAPAFEKCGVIPLIGSRLQRSRNSLQASLQGKVALRLSGIQS